MRNRTVLWAASTLICLIAGLASVGAWAQDASVFHVYLTWQGDTSNTITVNYHTAKDTSATTVLYDRVSREGDPKAYAHRAAGASHRIPTLKTQSGADRAIHVVELTGLEPGADYYFIAGDPEIGYSEERKFKTIPAGDASIRFVTGGDMGTDGAVRALMRYAASHDPMFGLIGGDIAYANGEVEEWRDWEAWLKLWERFMVGPDGHSIPMVLAIGNHEVNDLTGSVLERAPFYFGYFAQDGAGLADGRRSYFRRTFGDNLTIYCLDSNHLVSAAHQADWLKESMRADRRIEHSFAIYHIPLYPSHRLYAAGNSRAQREAWLPIFEEYGLSAGFENHDHMYKRTKRMIGGKADPNGILYLGDGAFGRNPRAGDQASQLSDPVVLEKLGLLENYLDKWASRLNFILVETPVKDSEAGITFTAIDNHGTVFDTYVLK